MERDFENLQLTKVLNEIEKITKSDLFYEIPIKEKLIMKNYQLYAIKSIGEYDIPKNVLEVLDEFETISEEEVLESGDVNLRLLFSAVKIEILFFRNKIKEAFGAKRSILGYIKDLKVNKIKKDYFKYLGLVYNNIYDLYKDNLYSNDEKFSFITECEKYWKNLTNPFYDHLIYSLKNSHYLMTGETEKQISLNLERKHNVEQQNQNSLFLSFPLQELSTTYIFTGNNDLKKAMLYNTESLELLDKINPSQEILEPILALKINAYNRRGILFSLMGDLKSCLKQYQEGLKYSNILLEKYGKYYNRNLILVNTGEYYLFIGENEKALNIINNIFVITDEIWKGSLGHIWSIRLLRMTEGNYMIFKVYLKLNKLDKAQECIENLKKLETEKIISVTVYNLIQAEYKLMEALLLLRSKNFMDTGKAKALLQEILTIPTKFELWSDAIIPLIEIVLLEYKTFQDKQILEEFKQLSDTITEIVEKNNSILLKIQFLIVQGKIAFINNEVQHSEEYCLRALEIAKKYESTDLVREASIELDLLKRRKVNIGDNTPENLKQRFLEIELEKYIKEAFNILKEK